MSNVLVDGNYLVCRSVFKGGHLKTSTGIPTGGIFLFLKSLLTYTRLGSPIVVFDSGRSKYRTDLYPDYKKKSPKVVNPESQQLDDLFSITFPVLKKLLPIMGIPVVCIGGEEADDVLYRMCQGLSSSLSYVVSDDNDYLQFLNLGAIVYQSMKDEMWTHDTFIEKMKFHPKRFTLWKSLIGDGSDNIPGVRGIGPVNATKIMNELKSESIEDLREWSDPGLTTNQKKIKENFSLVERNMLLIDLNNIPLTEGKVMDEYKKAREVSVIDLDRVIEEFKRFEFESLAPWIAYLGSKCTKSNSSNQ